LPRNVPALPSVPLVYGYRPDMSEARDAPQTGYWQCIFSKRTPRRASLSSSGVLHCGCPNPLNAVFRSSDIKNKTFGLDGFAKLETKQSKENEIR